MTNFNDVGEFHEKFGLPRVEERRNYAGEYPNEPGPREVDPELLAFRVKFLQEELAEFMQGIEEGVDHVQMADALVDLVYVAMGTAHLLGYPWERLWADVQAANMRKVRAASDGSDSKRGSAWDVVKPPGWQPPMTQYILRAFGFDV